MAERQSEVSMSRALSRVARSAGLIIVGMGLFLAGLAALGMPADLPLWRRILGVMLLASAVHLWVMK
jgi:uncharacterized membrane protein